ncbi:uncharacterized protein [Ptychodera flava]|uniref:uncharacterized protein n=1 Tax=Ptychodera flava TaxID=63121 RepID=UPI003969F6F9
MESADDQFIDFMEAGDTFLNINALASLYSPGSVIYKGQVKVKSRHGLLRSWQKRFLELRFPADLRLAKKETMDNAAGYSFVNYTEMKIKPHPTNRGFRKKFLKITLVSVFPDMTIQIQCTSKDQYRDLTQTLPTMLDMGTYERLQNQRILENIAADAAKRIQGEQYESIPLDSSCEGDPESSSFRPLRISEVTSNTSRLKP